MKRNFPLYAVGLDSTLDAIRKLDYERGLDDAAQICDDSFEFSTAIGQCAYQGDMAEAIRAYKSSESPGTQASRSGAVPDPSANYVVVVPKLAWEGFVGMVNARLGKPANRDKSPEELILMARAMLAAIDSSAPTKDA